jgi:hypothetical protein
MAEEGIFMAHTEDVVPSRDADFDGRLANLAGYVTGMTAADGPWTHIPADKVEALTGRIPPIGTMPTRRP